jgi:hypothetical protein
MEQDSIDDSAVFLIGDLLVRRSINPFYVSVENYVCGPSVTIGARMTRGALPSPPPRRQLAMNRPS